MISARFSRMLTAHYNERMFIQQCTAKCCNIPLLVRGLLSRSSLQIASKRNLSSSYKKPTSIILGIYPNSQLCKPNVWISEKGSFWNKRTVLKISHYPNENTHARPGCAINSTGIERVCSSSPCTLHLASHEHALNCSDIGLPGDRYNRVTESREIQMWREG